MSANRDWYRHTKIIATIGPATEGEPEIERLILAGVDIIRLNMAHASHAWVGALAGRVRDVSARVGRQVAIMMDVKGPEIRTGRVEADIHLERGEIFEFYTDQPTGDVRAVDVNYKGLPHDVELGSTVLVDSGLIRFEVLAKEETRIRCRVLIPGVLGSKRHINLPGVQVNLPSLTEKDRGDLDAGAALGMDFVALSFVRESEDIRILRRYLDSIGSRARIIAKIEDQAGVRNIADIVDEADGVMVARGDLGIEIDYHTLPLVQRQIVEACQSAGKPVIIATHLLESMIFAPLPTRAEISDVSTSVREMVDAVMLSGETTTGRYPHDCVDVLKNIARSTESTVDVKLNGRVALHEPKSKMLRSAALLAQDLGKSGIVVFTRSGFLGYMLGALRPRGVPIFAFTDDEVIFRQLLLPWGVEPFLIEFDEDPEKTIESALSYLKRGGWCAAGNWLVVITNALAHGQVIDSLQLRQVD